VNFNRRRSAECLLHIRIYGKLTRYQESLELNQVKFWGSTVIIILGTNPANNPLNPAAFPNEYNLDTTPPSPPLPLLICDKSVSAGYICKRDIIRDSTCDNVAAAIPATTPEVNSIEVCCNEVMFFFVSSDKLRRIISFIHS